MRVTCNLCKFEVSGTCQKQTKRGSSPKVKLTKRRNCSLYEEDTMKVFAKYRKTEAHKVNLRKSEIRRAKVRQAAAELQRERLTSSLGSSNIAKK